MGMYLEKAGLTEMMSMIANPNIVTAVSLVIRVRREGTIDPRAGAGWAEWRTSLGGCRDTGVLFNMGLGWSTLAP